MKPVKVDLFNELKILENGQELTPGEHFTFTEKKRKDDTYEIQKEVRHATRTTLHREYSCLRQCLSNPTPVARHSIWLTPCHA